MHFRICIYHGGDTGQKPASEFTFAPQVVSQRSRQVFYAWFSAFNLLGTRVSGTPIVKRCTRDQGARFFALIAIGGTLGAGCGS